MPFTPGMGACNSRIVNQGTELKRSLLWRQPFTTHQPTLENSPGDHFIDCVQTMERLRTGTFVNTNCFEISFQARGITLLPTVPCNALVLVQAVEPCFQSLVFLPARCKGCIVVPVGTAHLLIAFHEEQAEGRLQLASTTVKETTSIGREALWQRRHAHHPEIPRRFGRRPSRSSCHL